MKLSEELYTLIGKELLKLICLTFMIHICHICGDMIDVINSICLLDTNINNYGIKTNYRRKI